LREHLAKCPPCLEEWRRFESTLFIVSTVSQPLLNSEQTDQIWQACFQEVHGRIEQRRLQKQGVKQRPPLLNWLTLQPRLGWAALGSAVLVLVGVWFLAPQTVQSPDNINGPLPSIRQANVTFEMPPEGTSPLVNHHAATMFDPFTDHVGSTLVSYSATAEQP
jgi:hypothetical protein